MAVVNRLSTFLMIEGERLAPRDARERHRSELNPHQNFLFQNVFEVVKN